MERMIRRWKSLSREYVQNQINNSTPEQYAKGGLQNGEYMPPYSEELIGKQFSFQFENLKLNYSLTDLHTLEWNDGVTSRIEYYDGHMSEPGIFFFQHMIKNSEMGECRIFVVDENTGAVTLCRSHFDNGIEAREIAREFLFGTLAGSTPKELHHFTSDLVGKAIEWTYHLAMPPIKHIYSSELYYSYAMKFGDKCWMASNPADFVKINDHLYIFSFLEERQTGAQGFFLINIETLHDIGSFMSINGEDRFECYTVGAKGEWSTMETHLV